MIKDIIVNLSVGKPRDVASDFAVSTAALFGAHVSGLALAPEVPIGSLGDSVSTAIFNTYRAEQKAAAEHAVEAFINRARHAGVTFDSRILTEYVPEGAAMFGLMARNYDFSVVAQGEPDDDGIESLTIESALFDSGRPVLVVPYIQKEGLKLGRVMVCWDGSRSAARAVADALPLLQRAAQVDVVTVDRKERRNELRGAQIAEHLARHKVKVDLKSLVAPDSETADVLLSQAADSEADLIVMGGYGHSRLREFVLGGVTRSMLGAMTAPVLMSH
jgi:nucleotide-binding universal stress UspA family protein